MACVRPTWSDHLCALRVHLETECECGGVQMSRPYPTDSHMPHPPNSHMPCPLSRYVCPRLSPQHAVPVGCSSALHVLFVCCRGSFSLQCCEGERSSRGCQGTYQVRVMTPHTPPLQSPDAVFLRMGHRAGSIRPCVLGVWVCVVSAVARMLRAQGAKYVDKIRCVRALGVGNVFMTIAHRTYASTLLAIRPMGERSMF